MLRTPASKWHRLEDGKLVLEPRPVTIDQLANPSLLARRIEHHRFSASLELDFDAALPDDRAGMVLYRRSTCHYQFLKHGGDLILTRTEKGEQQEIARVEYGASEVILKAEANGLDLQFSYGKPGQELKSIGDVQSMSVLSFETAEGFNGPYVGLYASSGGNTPGDPARFDWFEYEGK
jgi:alpha-N-arabinofuranosidase